MGDGQPVLFHGDPPRTPPHVGTSPPLGLAPWSLPLGTGLSGAAPVLPPGHGGCPPHLRLVPFHSPAQKLVFNRVNGKRPQVLPQQISAPEECYTLAHEENVRFVYEGEGRGPQGLDLLTVTSQGC